MIESTKPSLDNVLIRPAAESDVTSYRELRLEALRKHPEAFGADYAQSAASPMAYWQERLQTNIDNPAAIMYFACVDNALVGMIGISRINSLKQQHTGIIWGVYVQPAWRSLHIAEALIMACITWAQGQPLRQVKLCVVTTNTSAIRCYARCGFSVYGVDPEVLYYNNVYYDELLMMRRV